MRRILITGGSGFIGTNLLEFYLRQSDVEIINIDSHSPQNSDHIKYWREANIFMLSLKDLTKMLEDFDPHYIFHLAARTDLDGVDIDSYKANTDGVENLILAAKTLKNLQRIGFASSRLVCEIGYQPKNDDDYLPTTFYGESKVLGEKIVKSETNKIDEWFIFRPTSIWGPWFGVPYLNFFMMVKKRLYFQPMGKAIFKSFGYVENSIYQLDRLMFAPVNLIHKKTFYLCDYPPLELSSWSEIIAKNMGLSKPKAVPFFVLKMAALIGDSLKLMGMKNPPLTSFRLNNLLTQMTYNTVELEKICGQLPYSLEEGVAKTVVWLRLRSLID